MNLSFTLGFKKVNKLAGTAVEPSNSISLHTKSSETGKKKYFTFTKLCQFLLFTLGFFPFSFRLSLPRKGMAELQIPSF